MKIERNHILVAMFAGVLAVSGGSLATMDATQAADWGNNSGGNVQTPGSGSNINAVQRNGQTAQKKFPSDTYEPKRVEEQAFPSGTYQPKRKEEQTFPSDTYQSESIPGTDW